MSAASPGPILGLLAGYAECGFRNVLAFALLLDQVGYEPSEELLEVVAALEGLADDTIRDANRYGHAEVERRLAG